MDFQKLLLKIGKILSEFKINYIVTGGFAVSIWGRTRSTADIDLAIELFPEQVRNVKNALQKISRAAYISEDAMKEAIMHSGEFNFIHPESGIKVDFFVRKDAIFKNELARRIAVRIGTRNVFFISPEDLVLSKLRWYQKSQSERHLEDAASTIRRQRRLDIKYLKKQARVQSCEEELLALLKYRNERS